MNPPPRSESSCLRSMAKAVAAVRLKAPYPLERNETLSRRANHITTHPECSGSAKRHAYQVPIELDVRPSHCSADVPSRT
jgi:hypothetical protein